MLRSNIPDRDATVVARMRAAGAILIGKTLCPPGGVGDDSWNSLHGGTRNPYDIARSPGTSSSGEAAIIAAGGSPAGLGSDSGGSIRMPAHYCGIAALKPTTGLVPSTGAYALPGGLTDPRSQVGPMARFVSDLALMLPVLVGPDGVDSGVVPVPLPRRTPRLKGLRVAWYADDGIAKPTQAISATVRASARALGDAGCIVTEARPPALHEAHQVTLGYWGDKRMSHERLYRRWDAFRTEMLGFMAGFVPILRPLAPPLAPLFRPKQLGPHTPRHTSPSTPRRHPLLGVRPRPPKKGLPRR